ncbi:MAG TPA: CDP-glycerol--glycerophosphate glycerophosphotransferase [Phycisphaerae bacterium]|nr:CDP-glycerol--glycerophosphate glycerophosphotransferase [Phycisphaerae bacterium]HON64982.1 CDP-glycerol--glycerophosphate glycerophosphotransferase [Phycisphaerae bacterium]HQE26259.1 CDP-glycerol--glycerophosphate glycerophosphotransferase [Phycisphaerae bacterium]
MFRFPGQSLLEDWASARRFQALPDAARSIVFYAEDGDSWPHFEPIVRELTGEMGREVCYLTSSRSDPVLRTSNPRIRPFCIGEGLVRTSLFLSLRAGVCVMTMPDLQTFHLKRSQAQNVHYVYVFHSMVSTHMIYRKAAFDAFDTILCVGPHHEREIRATEQTYGLAPKKLIPCGYGRLDTMLASRRAGSSAAPNRSAPAHVLVAPSWGPHGLLETRGVELCRVLLSSGLRVTVRPHPMTRRKWPECIREIERGFGGEDRLTLETGVAAFDSLESADVMISDWSGAALEFAFAYERPVLFVDVPRKVNNPEYERISCEPLEVSIREQVGRVISPDRLADLPMHLEALMRDGEGIRARIQRVRAETVYNVSESGRVGARAIAEIAGGQETEDRRQETEGEQDGR